MRDEITNLIGVELGWVNDELNNLSVGSLYVKDDILNFVSGPSKRIRTIVTVLYLKAYGVTLNSDCIKVLAAGEIIHNASLLHDDVIDEAKKRRGQITIGEKYSPYVSILSGDYLLSLATEKLLSIDKFNILKAFLDCTKEMCNAELSQFFTRGKKNTIEDYISICEGKTAKLFETIMYSCSLILGIASKESSNFAKNFGILFQLYNDLAIDSAKADRSNNIYTLKDIIGIEKTYALMDNYQRILKKYVEILPESSYKKSLGDLLKYYE